LFPRPTSGPIEREKEDADVHRLSLSARPFAAAARPSLKEGDQDQQEERPPVDADGRSEICLAPQLVEETGAGLTPEAP